MSVPIRAVAAAGILALSALGLTACADAGQSRHDACTVLSQELPEIKSELIEANSSLNGDPEAAITQFRAAAGSLSGMQSRISNEQLAPLTSSTVTALTEYTELLDAMSQDPEDLSLDAFQATATAFQTSWSQLSAACD